jgi:crotonobetainyl-CoA:carnitine CoA-transferase CaiB-like acyl-CoA transferase
MIKAQAMETTASFARDLQVVDLGLGMSAALFAKLLVECGAEVTRLEPEAGDPFYQVYPAYAVWQRGKRIEKSEGSEPERLDALLDKADICIVGGEDYPGRTWRLDAVAMSARHERLIVTEIDACPPGLEGRNHEAVDLLAQARSGLSHEHFSTRAIAFALPAPTYGAAIQAMLGTLAALYAREDSGRGQVVSTSLLQGALSWLGPLWFQASKPDALSDGIVPLDPRQLIFRCADGHYVQMFIAVAGGLGKLYKVLGIEDASINPSDRGISSGAGDPKKFFGDVELIGNFVARWKSTDLLESLRAGGLAGERVSEPGVCWDDPQASANGIIRTDEQGMRYVGLPMQGL